MSSSREQMKKKALSTIRQVAKFWTAYNLNGRRLKLDEMGLQIAEQQEQSKLSRKSLSEKIREFKSLADEEKLKNSYVFAYSSTPSMVSS